MKKCPYCAEQIQDEAIVCRYCGRDLVKTGKPSKSTFSPYPPIVAGLILATLVLLREIATKPYPNLGNLIFHFIANAVIWAIIIGLLIWAWRYQIGRIILVGIVVIGLIVFLIFISGGGSKSFALIPTPYNPTTPPQRTTPTSPLLEPKDTQKPNTTVVSTIVPILRYPQNMDPEYLGQKFLESDTFKTAQAKYAGKTLVPKYTFPKVVTGRDYAPPSINANEIDDSYVGENMSVFGIVSDVYRTDEFAQLIVLSGNENFQLRGYYTTFDDADTGRCIFVTGDIQQDETSLYLVIDGARVSAWDECR